GLDTYQLVNNTSLTRGKNLIKFGIDYQHFNRSTSLPILAGGFASFTSIDFAAATGIPSLPFFTGLQAFDPPARTPQQLAFLTLLASLLPNQFPTFPKNLPLAQLALPVFYLQGFGDPNLTIDGDFFSVFAQDDLKLSRQLLIKGGVRYDINRA